jgi:malate dehydrogenase (oxaloacetate-decarboxylating)
VPDVGTNNQERLDDPVGLGVVASRARRVTDGMLEAAARALGELSPARTDRQASLLPPVDRLRATAPAIAAAVAIAAVQDGVAPPARDDELHARVAASRWRPEYR